MVRNVFERLTLSEFDSTLENGILHFDLSHGDMTFTESAFTADVVRMT